MLIWFGLLYIYIYEISGPEINSKPCKKPEKKAGNFYFLELFLQQVLYLLSFYSLTILTR